MTDVRLSSWTARLGAALPALLLFVAPSVHAQPSTSRSDSARAADELAGKAIFASQCAVCHGAEGAGGVGPTLRRPTLSRAPDDDALVALIRNGISGTSMPFFELALTERMLQQVARYVRTLGRVPAVAVPGDASRGEQIYAARGCGACHTIRGTGGTLGPDLSSIAYSKGPAAMRESVMDPAADHPVAYRVARVELAGAEPRRGIVVDEDVFWIQLRDVSGRLQRIAKTADIRIVREERGTLMPSYRSSLSDPELTDLVAFLSTLRGHE